MADTEKVKIELKISSNDLSKSSEKLNKEIEAIRKRIKRFKEFIGAWQRTECFKALEKAHVPFVTPPIKKTNLIAKNPNFQIATKLWDYLLRYEENNADDKNNLNTSGDDLIKGILDDAFLMNYFVLDSISSLKREQKERLSQYAAVMINHQLKRLIAMFLNSGVEITEKEILDMVAKELKNGNGKTTVDTTEVKKKFQTAVDEYLKQSKNQFK